MTSQFSQGYPESVDFILQNRSLCHALRAVSLLQVQLPHALGDINQVTDNRVSRAHQVYPIQPVLNPLLQAHDLRLHARGHSHPCRVVRGMINFFARCETLRGLTHCPLGLSERTNGAHRRFS